MLNEKAYALSVRDDTSFRVESGLGDSTSDSHYSIATITVSTDITDANSMIIVTCPSIRSEGKSGDSYYAASFYIIDASSPTTIDAILYDGVCYAVAFESSGNSINVNCSGGVSYSNYSPPATILKITGDGSIEIPADVPDEPIAV